MKVGYPDTMNKKQSGIISPLKCFGGYQHTDPDGPCYSPKTEKAPAKKKSRSRVKTIGEKNFESEKRSPGFAEDITKTQIQKDTKARNEKISNPKPKAKVLSSPAKYAETPINMKTPVKARSRKSGDINYKKADRLNKRVDRLEKRLEKSGIKKAKGGSYTGNEGYVGDSRREIRVRKQDRKAGAAAGYGNMDEAKSTAKLDKKLAKKGYKRTPVKNRDIIAENRAARKAAAEKAKKAEDAIRQSQSSSKPTATTTKKKGVLAKRKERRAERNPKVAERQKGRAERKELRENIKTEKARVTTARQDRKTSKTTDRLARVKKKVDSKVNKIKSPTKFASNAQRKAVWASKNEKKKNK